MKYDVKREHIGDRLYRKGEVRECNPSTVTHLVRKGILSTAKGQKAAKPPANKAAPKLQNKAGQ